MPTDDDIPLVFHTRSRLRRDDLRNFLTEVSRRIARATVSCLVTTDDELRKLNQEYRGQNHATDVLSFAAAASAGNGRGPNGAAVPFAGDLAISLDRARAQAAEHGHSLENELKILMLHGVLHLAGMDHEADRGEMRRAEIRWRRKLGLPVSLIERSAVPANTVKPRVKRANERLASKTSGGARA